MSFFGVHPMPIEPSEHLKHSFEYLRHITTLSAGAIVLQIGFVEKLFPYPKWRALVAISIISFTASILSSVLTQWKLLSFLGYKSTQGSTAAGCFVILMWLGFIVGIVSAVTFALINLFLK
jgi:hypothetical protein